MIGLVATERRDLRRWAMSAAVVALAHAGGAAAVVAWREQVDPAEPASAIVVEFAPLPVAPPNRESDIPPGPEQVMSDASPERPIDSIKEPVEEKPEQKTEPVEERPPEVKPAPDPEVALPLPTPAEKQETPQRQDPRLPAPTTSMPQAAPLETAAIPAAPVQGPPAAKSSNAIPTWKSQVAALLERNKRYPPVAQARGERGIAQVFFSLDRQGRVIDSRVLRSSGAAALDQEALALLQRAQPFPAPPSELAGARVDLTVPIRFNLK
jgi:protein TonB